MFIIEKLYLM